MDGDINIDALAFSKFAIGQRNAGHPFQGVAGNP
jgi:hypothetical protein